MNIDYKQIINDFSTQNACKKDKIQLVIRIYFFQFAQCTQNLTISYVFVKI